MTKIGFIGQGFIGGNMANEFEGRGYEVVRYSKNRFPENLEALKECEIVFVGVPTPTKNRKFDGSVLDDAIATATYPGQLIVIKSTVYPGTTDRYQTQYPDRYFFHSAEFLTERNAENDVKNPSRTVLGYAETSIDEKSLEGIVDLIISVLPRTTNTIICTARQSELGKYFSNFLMTTKLIMANLMYDVCDEMSEDYEVIKEIAGSDPRIGMSHLDCVFEGGRGAGGHCFPKDLATFAEFYSDFVHGFPGMNLFTSMQHYNALLLSSTGKDIDIINEVMGTSFISKK